MGAQQLNEPVCDCWCRLEETCRAGKMCPYHPKFWPDMFCPSEEDAVENETQEEEPPMANLMVSSYSAGEDLSKSFLSEEASMEDLADMEYRTLIAELPRLEFDC